MELDRRRVLQALGVSGMAGVAGCLGVANPRAQSEPEVGRDAERDDPGTDVADNDQTDATDDGETGNGSPSFYIATMDLPDSVTIDETVKIAVDVGNQGDDGGTAEVTLWVDRDAFAEAALDIEAGETETTTFEITTSDFEPKRHRVSATITDDEVRDWLNVTYPAPPENGVVAFVYHDGPIHDYTQAFPAHEAYNTPATTCVVSDWIGTTYGVADRLDEDHLQELHEAGWEIASHTVDHSTLGEFDLIRDAAADDRRVYPERHRHGHHEGLEVTITDGENTVRRTVAGFDYDENGEVYVELSEEVGKEFSGGETVIRRPTEHMEYTLRESKEALEAMGLQVDTLLAPYDNFGDYAMQFVPDYYDYVANASRETPRINDRAKYDPYDTRHRYFIEYTSREAVKADLDKIAEAGAFGVFGAHAFKEEVTEARIRETLEWIEERDIEVMTFREAATLYANYEAGPSGGT